MEDQGDFLPIHQAVLDGKIQQLQQIVTDDPQSITLTTSKGLSPFHLCFSPQQGEGGGKVSPLTILNVLLSSSAREEAGKVLDTIDPWQGNTPIHSLIDWFNNHKPAPFRVFGVVLYLMFEIMVKNSLEFLVQQNRDGETPLTLLSKSPSPISLFPLLARLIPSKEALETFALSSPSSSLSLLSSYPTNELPDELEEEEENYLFLGEAGEGGKGRVVRRCREGILGRGGGEVSVEEGDVVEVLFVVYEWAYVVSWGGGREEKGFLPRRCVLLGGSEKGGKVRRFTLEASEDEGGVEEMLEGKVPTKSLSLQASLDVFCHPKLASFRSAFLLAHKTYLTSVELMEGLLLRFCLLTYQGGYLHSTVAQAVKEWRHEYPEDWMENTVLEKQFTILQKLEKILCKKLLLTPNAGLGKKEEEGDKEAKSLKVDISLPKRSISVNVTQKMTTESFLILVGKQLQMSNLCLLEDDLAFSPTPSSPSSPPSPPSISPPTKITSPSLAVLSSPRSKQSYEADAFFATESTQLLKSLKNDLAYSIQKKEEEEEEEEGMYIIGVGNSFDAPKEEKEEEEEEEEMYIMGVSNEETEMFIMGVEQNETPRGRDPRRDPALKAAKRAANSRKDSDAQNSEGSFSDGLRRKQRPQGMLGMSQSMSTSKRRSAAIQPDDIQQFQSSGMLEDLKVEKKEKSGERTNAPSKERARRRKVGGAGKGFEEKAIELQAGVLVGTGARHRDSLVVRDIEIMAGFWDGVGGGKEESGGSGAGVGWGGAGTRKIPKEKKKKEKGKGEGGLLRAFSPGRKRAGEDEEWMGGVLGEEKKKSRSRRREKECASPPSPTSPLTNSSRSSGTPRAAREVRGLSPLPSASRASPPSRTPPLPGYSPLSKQKKREEEKKKVEEREVEEEEKPGNLVEGEALVFNLFTTGKQLYLSNNEGYYRCIYETLNRPALSSLPSLSPLPRTPYTSSLPLFPTPSLSDPYSLFLFVSPLEIAQRVTLHHHSLLLSFSSRAGWEEGKGAEELVQDGEGMKQLVLDIMLSLIDLKQRGAFLKKMIQLAVNFFNLNNYFGTWVIHSVLSHPSVIRLRKTMSSLDEEARDSLQAIKYLVSEDKDYHVYRKAILRARPPLVPLVSPILEGNGAKNNRGDDVDLANLMKTTGWLFNLWRGKEMMYQFSCEESENFKFDQIQKKTEQQIMWMSDSCEPKDPTKIIFDLLLQKRELEKEIERLKKEKEESN